MRLLLALAAVGVRVQLRGELGDQRDSAVQAALGEVLVPGAFVVPKMTAVGEGVAADEMQRRQMQIYIDIPDANFTTDVNLTTGANVTTGAWAPEPELAAVGAGAWAPETTATPELAAVGAGAWAPEAWTPLPTSQEQPAPTPPPTPYPSPTPTREYQSPMDLLAAHVAGYVRSVMENARPVDTMSRDDMGQMKIDDPLRHVLTHNFAEFQAELHHSLDTFPYIVEKPAREQVLPVMQSIGECLQMMGVDIAKYDCGVAKSSHACEDKVLAELAEMLVWSHEDRGRMHAEHTLRPTPLPTPPTTADPAQFYGARQRAKDQAAYWRWLTSVGNGAVANSTALNSTTDVTALETDTTALPSEEIWPETDTAVPSRTDATALLPPDLNTTAESLNTSNGTAAPTLESVALPADYTTAAPSAGQSDPSGGGGGSGTSWAKHKSMTNEFDLWIHHAPDWAMKHAKNELSRLYRAIGRVHAARAQAEHAAIE